METDAYSDYVTSGRLLADARRWAKDPMKAYQVETPQRDPDSFAARLPTDARGAFLELVRLLREEELPGWTHFSPESGSFGLEICDGTHAWRVHGRLRLLDDKKGVDRGNSVFPLATDGSGNLFVLLDDGRVGSLSREEDGIIGDWFPCIDSYLFTMVRLSATPKHRSVAETVAELQDVEGAEEYVEELLER